MSNNRQGHYSWISSLLKGIVQIMLQGNSVTGLPFWAGIFGLFFVMGASALIALTSGTFSETNSCNVVHSTVLPDGFQMFLVDAGQKSDNSIIQDASNKCKRFSFCRFGKTNLGARVIEDIQYFNTGSFIQSFLSASAELYPLPDCWSYDTHIQNRLRGLLYPKHSFW